MFKIYSQQVYYPESRDVLIVDEAFDGRFSVAAPLVMSEQHPNDLVETPTIRGRQGLQFLQAAIDHAWGIGLRPTGATMETAAMQAHLQDLRALVFKGEVAPK